MEADSPTQHSPIYVDVQSHYRVTFDNMKYLSVNKHWEIAVKLEDKKEEQVLGETNILWPHADPPHTITYDSEHNLLHWENNESLAYLPIQIPSRPVYDISAAHVTKSNPKILIRPSLSLDSDRSNVKILRETPWKELIVSKKFLKKTKADFQEITHKFNPLFEDRLTPEQQQKALNLFAQSKNSNVHFLMGLLLDMSFFDLSSLNAFIVEQFSAAANFSSLPTKRPKLENGVSDTQQNGTSEETNAVEKNGYTEERKLSKNAKKLIDMLLKNPHLVLCDNAFVALLRYCSCPKLTVTRALLIKKNLPLDGALRQRIFRELENEAIVSLLELYTVEYITKPKAKPDLVEKVLDLLLFITNGFNDKLLWEDVGDLTQRVHVVANVLKASSAFSLTFKKATSSQNLAKVVNRVVPQNDYQRTHTKFRRYLIDHENQALPPIIKKHKRKADGTKKETLQAAEKEIPQE